jgi:molecular chaperone Hsp33
MEPAPYNHSVSLPRDHLIRAIWREKGLRVMVALATQVSREARDAHRCAPTSSAMLAQGVTAGALLASALGKERGRVNLQVACDGPAGGMFIDAGTDGSIRGYVKNPNVFFASGAGEALRPERALGRVGYVSVLRDHGAGEIYSGMVELTACELAADLDHYFAASEQTDTSVALSVLAEGSEPLGVVAGLLVQRLPHGDPTALQRVREAFRAGALDAALAADRSVKAITSVLGVSPEQLDLLSDYPLTWQCGCSRARALVAVMTMGIDEMQSLEREKGEAELTCHFCGRSYRVAGDELRSLIRSAAAETL